MSPLQYLFSLVPSTPFILALLGAIVFAAVTWQRHPRASSLLGLASVLELVSFVGGGATSAWMASSMMSSGHPERAGIVYAVIAGVQAILSAAAWALVALAIFRPGPPLAAKEP